MIFMILQHLTIGLNAERHDIANQRCGLMETTDISETM